MWDSPDEWNVGSWCSFTKKQVNFRSMKGTSFGGDHLGSLLVLVILIVPPSTPTHRMSGTLPVGREWSPTYVDFLVAKINPSYQWPCLDSEKLCHSADLCCKTWCPGFGLRSVQSVCPEQCGSQVSHTTQFTIPHPSKCDISLQVFCTLSHKVKQFKEMLWQGSGENLSPFLAASLATPFMGCLMILAFALVVFCTGN